VFPGRRNVTLRGAVRGLASGLGAEQSAFNTRRKEAALNSKAESENSSIRLVLMSDTHGHHRQVEVADGDLLIHAGDFTFFNGSTFAIRDFNDWLGQLPHRSKVLIPGNHDSGFVDPAFRELITEARLLINEGTVMQGLRIWGSPCTPNDWGAFGPGTAQEQGELYSRIPEDTDILVTHGPPLGILDQSALGGEAPGVRSAANRSASRQTARTCLWPCPSALRHGPLRRHAVRKRGSCRIRLLDCEMPNRA